MNRADTKLLIESFFAMINGRNFDAVLDCLHEDLVFEFTPGERHFGRQTFRHFLAERLTGADEQIGDIAIMIGDDGTRAAAEFTRRGRSPDIADGAQPGEHYSHSDGMFFAVEDGLIVRITGCGAFAESLWDKA